MPGRSSPALACISGANAAGGSAPPSASGSSTRSSTPHGPLISGRSNSCSAAISPRASQPRPPLSHNQPGAPSQMLIPKVTAITIGTAHPSSGFLRLAAGPDRHALQRQADPRRDEPRGVVLVLRPDVPNDDGRPIALDRPALVLGRRLERRSLLGELEPLGQRHVERFGALRMVALGHAATLPRPRPASLRVAA